CFYGANGRELLRIVAEGIRAVLRVVDFLHQAGMRDGNVIALEIVVDVNFPIAIDDVIAALGKLQTLELETLRLLRSLAEVWRQTLLKARSAPSLPRTTMIGSPETSAVKKLSGSEMVRFTPFTSPQDWVSVPTSRQVRWKMRDFSISRMAGSV